MMTMMIMLKGKCMQWANAAITLIPIIIIIIIIIIIKIMLIEISTTKYNI